MDTKNSNATPKKDTTTDLYHFDYGDEDVPEIDMQDSAKDIIPDEVPRRDGPGGN